MFGLPSPRMSWGLAAFAVLLVLVPFGIGNAYVLHVLILSLLFASFSLAWHLVTGYGGLKTFGHQAFFGIGAYTSALIAKNYGVSPWITLPAVGFAAALAGLLIATPVLRIRSMPHVAIVTLCFAEIVRVVLSNWRDVTRGELGLWGIPTFEGFHLPLVGEVVFNSTNKTSYYYLVLLIFFVVCAMILGLMRSRFGLAVTAMREAEGAAQSLGINIVAYKLFLFGLSAFIVGVCGAFYAHYLLLLTPTSAAGIDLIILVVAMTLVGGPGSFAGPIIGAFLLTIAGEWLRGFGEYRMLVYGLVIILSVMFFPGGLVKLFDRFFRPSKGDAASRKVA